MDKLYSIFDFPKELGSYSERKQALISPNFLAVLGNNNKLQIYSIQTKKIEFSIDNVSSFCWMDSTHFKSYLLCAMIEGKLTIFTSEATLPEIVVFDPSTRKAPVQQIESGSECVMHKIIEFLISPDAEIATAMEANSLLVLNRNVIEKYVVYTDGLYCQTRGNSENCNKITFDGANLCGISQNIVNIWNTQIEDRVSYQIKDCENVFPIAPQTFGVISGNKLSVINKNDGITKNEEVPEGTKFAVLLEDNSLFAVPKDLSIIFQSFQCPLFANDSTAFILDENMFIGRIIGIMPGEFAINLLCQRGSLSPENASFVAEVACQNESVELVKKFSAEATPENALAFSKKLVAIIEEKYQRSFAITISSTIIRLLAKHIGERGELYEKFVPPLCTFRSIIQCPHKAPTFAPSVQGLGEQPPIGKDELLNFVIDALHMNAITSALPTLAASFPDFSPFHLFRTIVLQQAWEYVCKGQLNNAYKLIEELGEDPGQHFHEMWRQTTRNKTRALLHDYLHKHGLLSQKDETNHQILLKITTRYPNTSFALAKKLNTSPAMKLLSDPTKLPPWQPIVDLTADFDESKAMVFPDLFKIPPEPVVESSKYFLGNIVLIEVQSQETINMLISDQNSVERLWILHCEHRVSELVNLFKKEIDKAKGEARLNLKCVQFTNKYYSQMNTYELETLLDVLCQNGLFTQHELDDFELLISRICKNKYLFDQQWWVNTTLNFTTFFKRFAVYCSQKSLFMPFEMFVVSHPKAKDIDMSDIKEPLIRFIWDLWVKRDPAAANLSCMQLIAHSESEDPQKLWQSLPSDSLAPLASFVWNKDPGKFNPGSPETIALSERLKQDYPLLSSLVKGEIPHPPSPHISPPPSKWRSPIFTSKYDLELHDLVSAHFDYDFSKVFTNYYGNTAGQPPFPHFDHPELITAPSEPPYVHYVKSMLPVSAFQQAIEDGVSEDKFKELSLQCMKEALLNRGIRLAALTFIELVDQMFGNDSATDYKLAVAIFDNLSNDNNSVLFEELSNVFVKHCKVSARSIQKKLAANEIELFLLSTLLGVRCDLPLDFTAIEAFAKKARPAELLLFIDCSAEIGANYPITEVVKIIRNEMPENPLKDHLLFHLTQTLPTEEGSGAGDIPPALVVFRAIRKSDQPQYVSLLQEALNRKTQLYALLATSIDGSDPMICALVTLLTMTDMFTFDITNPPPHEETVDLFLSVLSNLLDLGKSSEVKQALELFSNSTIALHIATFANSVENFLFHQAELTLEKINKVIYNKLPDSVYQDDLFGAVKIEDILNIFFPLIDNLAKKCGKKSQVHLFRFLQLFKESVPSPFLKPLVKVVTVIEKFENFRKAIMQVDLLGPPSSIVSGLVLNHSLALGHAVAEVLGTNSSNATQEWLKYQYSTALTPSQVLDIHSQIVSSIKDGNPTYFIALFASLLPYTQMSEVVEILKYARSCFKEENELSKNVDALLLHIKLCSELSIEVPQIADVQSPLQDILRVLFPNVSLSDIPMTISLSITSPVIYGLTALKRFFEISIDKTIDTCLDMRKVNDARLLCEWRDRNPKSILLLEAVQKSIAGERLSYQENESLLSYGFTDDLEQLLNAIAAKNGWRFILISLHFKAAKRLGWPTEDLLNRKTTEFVASELSITKTQWDLVKDLIEIGKLSDQQTAECLSHAFTDYVCKQLETNTTKTSKDCIDITDYSEQFAEFTKLCSNPSLVGDALFTRAKEINGVQPIAVVVNILLHASMCTADIDECAEMFDQMLATLIEQKHLSLIVDVVTIFKDPALLPRYFQHLIAQEKLDALPHDILGNEKEKGKKVGRVIMNCARHVQPFEPQKYFDLTLNYSLYRDHAELQMECGLRILTNLPTKDTLQEASRHFLLALAYFLHEKCYSLSMECLKKLSLISLQQEFTDINVLHLDTKSVLNLMKTKDFPFALTIAVAYDMDTESNWAEAIYTQCVVNKGEEFLTAFQYFRPITSSLCDSVVEMYKNSALDDEQTKRMRLFLKNIPNLVERYRIAKELQFQDQIDAMKEQNPVVCEWCERVLMEGN